MFRAYETLRVRLRYLVPALPRLQWISWRFRGLNLLPSAEREDFLSRAKARKINPAVFAAPAVGSEGNLEAHQKARRVSLAGPGTQIHTFAARAASPFQVGRNKGSGDESRPAVLTAQRRHEPAASFHRHARQDSRTKPAPAFRTGYGSWRQRHRCQGSAARDIAGHELPKCQRKAFADRVRAAQRMPRNFPHRQKIARGRGDENLFGAVQVVEASGCVRRGGCHPSGFHSGAPRG